MARSKKELVLVGGGHSHVQVLRSLAMEPPPEARLTLVVDTPIAVYSGMVPGHVAGQYRVEELEIDVLPLARRASARVIMSATVAIDAEGRRIELEGRPSIPYDLASLDIGSTVAGLDLPGIREHALPTRPISELVRRGGEIVERAQGRAAGSPFRVIVVGGGAGGVELAFTLWQRLGAESDPAVEVRLVNAAPRVLPGYPAALVRRVLRHAERRGIGILNGCKAAGAEAERLLLADGESLPCEALVWVTGAVSHPLFRQSGLPTDARGFVRTRPTLQVEGHDDLFAVGDCATLNDHPRTPKAGVYAVRQGPYLTDNLRAALAGRPLKKYTPQRDFLTLLNLGDGTALGAKWGRSFEGAWVMDLKDRIDRKFMRKFQVLDPRGAMTEDFAAQPEMGGGMEMLCGGCAAKVGRSVLERALERVSARYPAPEDATVRLGLELPDDAAAWESPGGDVVVSSLDAFRAFTDDPWLVGKVAAVNAVSDLQAKGVEARYALALVAVPEEAGDAEAEETLFQILAGLRSALDPLGVTLLGGHTITAPELSVGLSVEGLASPGTPLLTLDGLREGQALVLTKALGTGVIFHADMKGRAPGSWVQTAVASMVRPNGPAARIAGELGATAATDVTGFGLLGHLAEMLRASGVSAILDPRALPALPGAVELMAQGLRSTFHPENERARKGIVIRPEAAAHPKLPLLFDPQTSGGLLFGVPAGKEEEVLAKLREEGIVATVIGRVLPRREDGALVEVVVT